MKIIILILTLFIQNLCLSQNVKLKTKTKIQDTILNVEYTVTNESKNTIVLYMPTEDDFCNGILNISFKNDKQEVTYYQCDKLEHLDAIKLTCSNTRILGSQEKLVFSLRITKPLLFNRDDLLISCEINYEDIYFIMDKIGMCDSPVFQQILSTSYEPIDGNG